MMSLRAELLGLSMKALKLSKSKRHISMAKARSRLRLIELIVPRPPSETKSTAIDVDGIKAIEITGTGGADRPTRSLFPWRRLRIRNRTVGARFYVAPWRSDRRHGAVFR